jgi:hypothetical protein
MSAEPLGRSVLELATDQGPLNQGLAQARAETVRQTEAMRAAARIDLRANLLRLQADFNQAQRLARETAQRSGQQNQFELRANLAKFQSDLRQAEREQAESLRRMRQQSGDSGLASLPGLGSGGLLAGFVGGVGAGATNAALGALASGFGQVEQAGEAATGVVIDYNAAVQSATANIKAFTGGQQAVAADTAIANKQLALGRSTYEGTLTALASLTPLARRYNENLQELLTTSQLLAASDPEQGFAGAAIALREALSGDFTSLTRRFEIPRTEINRLKAEGLPNLEIVKRALADLGITESLLDERATTFTQRQTIALDTLQKFIAAAGKPLFDTASDSLAGFIKLLNDPAIQQAGAQFADKLATNLNDIRHVLDELRGNADLRGIAEGAGEAAGAAHDLYDSLEGVRRVVTLGGLERLLVVVRDFSAGVGYLGTGVSHLLELGAQLRQEFDGEIERLREIARLAGLIGPAAPVATTGSVVKPAVQASAPQTDAQFDITARSNEGNRQRDLFEQGRKDLQAYIDGFSSSQLDIFGKLDTQIHSAFDRIFGNLDISDQFDKGLGSLDGITARMIDDLHRLGHVSDETAAQAKAVLGDQAQAVIDLANQYGQLARAQAGVTASTEVLRIAQANLTRVEQEAAAGVADAEHALEVARGVAQTRQQQAQNAVAGLQQALAALGRQATAQQRAADQAARESQATITQAQQQQSSLQQAAQLHAAAYAAVLAGTTDEFLRQNDALDEQTRKIIENGNAQVAAALKAKTAQDSVVQGLEERERRTQLSFDERIRSARNKRTPEGDREANALTEERDREIAKLEYQLQIERERAAVRADEANAAKKPVEDAAQAQADTDKKATDAAGKRVDELQEQARIRAESDRAAAQALADQQQAIQDQITTVQEKAAQQKIADDAAIVGAQTALGLVQQIENTRIDAAKQGVINAQGAVNTANAELVAQKNVLTVMGQKQTALDAYIKSWTDFVDYLKSQNIPVPQFFGAPSTQTTPAPQYSPVPGNVDDPSQRGDGGTGSPAKQPGQPLTLPSAPRPPPPSGTPFFSRAAMPTYRPPVPPSSNLAAYSTPGTGAGAVPAAGRGPVTFSAPITVTGNQFTSDIDVQRAMQEAAAMQARTLLAALGEDDRGGGSASNWRA